MGGDGNLCGWSQDGPPAPSPEGAETRTAEATLGVCPVRQQDVGRGPQASHACSSGTQTPLLLRLLNRAPERRKRAGIRASKSPRLLAFAWKRQSLVTRFKSQIHLPFMDKPAASHWSANS